MTTTASIPTLPAVPAAARTEPDADLVLAGPGVPLLDRIAMRAGLALLLWGRRHAERIAPAAARPALIGDARWYMR